MKHFSMFETYTTVCCFILLHHLQSLNLNNESSQVCNAVNLDSHITHYEYGWHFKSKNIGITLKYNTEHIKN